MRINWYFQVQLESLVKTKESISGITLCAKIDKKGFGKHQQTKAIGTLYYFYGFRVRIL